MSWRAVDRRQDALDFQRELSQLFKVGPVNEHGHVALDAGDQLVDSHFDRLTETEFHARNVLREKLIHLLDQHVA